MKTMMRKSLLLVCALSAGMTVWADDKATQEVLIDGQTVTKNISKITFEGDNAVLTFADESRETVDMESVVINFAYTTLGVHRVEKAEVKEQKVYNLKGMHVKNTTAGLSKGVYVVDGKKVIVK